MEKLKPKLFSVMKTYNKEQFVKDVIAGIIVAIIALPLSIALAIASGVGPTAGIYTAIIAGFLVAFLGGSRVQIAGPTAAFATIVAGIVAKDGTEGLMVATIMAGIILILMGLLKFGNLIKFIPFTITTGFTAGIAVTLFIGQIKDFCGLTYPEGTPTIETKDKVIAIVKNISTINITSVLIGVLCLAILIICPKIFKKLPGSLIAVVVSAAIVAIFDLNVNTIGKLYTITNELPSFTVTASTFTIANIKGQLGNAVTIALLAGIESLLSAVVADSMINSKHRSNMELIAQGVANMGSACFGGIPATGAIARTAANIKNGGRTPISGMVHSITLVLVLVFLMPYASMIPMPCIAAILFQVAYNMSGWRKFVELFKKAPKMDVLVLVVTFVLTVVFDLVVAIEVGLVLAAILFMKRMSDVTDVDGWTYIDQDDENDKDSLSLRVVPEHTLVYEVSGPMFFGAADKIARISMNDDTKCIVVRMRSVNAIDATAINSLSGLYDTCEKKHVQLVFSHLNEHPRQVMEKAGLIKKIGAENFCKHIDDALARAAEIVSK